MSDKQPHSGHRERLRRRFRETGLAGFNDHEILELLLFYSIPRANTNPAAHSLLEKFGSLEAVFCASEAELTETEGIGAASASLIALVGEIIHMFRAQGGIVPPETADYYAVLDRFFMKAGKGSFTVIFADPLLGIISSRTAETADIISGKLPVRRLISDAIVSDAEAVIIGISHGSEPPVPSEQDFRLVKLITRPLTSIGTVVTDVIINGGGENYSMREHAAFAF
ncbi:MAG: hypothetical protein IKO47_03115 [Ruminococcus sp.]|nr:hypothetical protein [Ruminococcus sp.]